MRNGSCGHTHTAEAQLEHTAKAQLLPLLNLVIFDIHYVRYARLPTFFLPYSPFCVYFLSLETTASGHVEK